MNCDLLRGVRPLCKIRKRERACTKMEMNGWTRDVESILGPSIAEDGSCLFRLKGNGEGGFPNAKRFATATFKGEIEWSEAPFFTLRAETNLSSFENDKSR